MSFNKTIVLGKLGQDVDLKTMPNGNNVANFSVATNLNWMKDGKKETKTTWHKIVVYGKMADVCAKYLSKGSDALVEGRLEHRSWENKEGEKRYTTEIIANNIQFINGNNEKNKALNNIENTQQDMKVSTDASFASDEIPF